MGACKLHVVGVNGKPSAAWGQEVAQNKKKKRATKRTAPAEGEGSGRI